MWISMLEFISGGRADGSEWPPKGVVFEVSDAEGEHLIRGQLAQRAAPPEPPPQSALKAEWVDYAVSKGADPAEAAEQTKAQLQSPDEAGDSPSASETAAATAAAPVPAAAAAVVPAAAAAKATVTAAETAAAEADAVEAEAAAEAEAEAAEAEVAAAAVKKAPEPEKIPRPAPGDPKSAWVEYAVSQGTRPDEASGLTKAQLQSAFGGRL